MDRPQSIKTAIKGILCTVGKLYGFLIGRIATTGTCSASEQYCRRLIFCANKSQLLLVYCAYANTRAKQVYFSAFGSSPQVMQCAKIIGIEIRESFTLDLFINALICRIRKEKLFILIPHLSNSLCGYFTLGALEQLFISGHIQFVDDGFSTLKGSYRHIKAGIIPELAKIMCWDYRWLPTVHGLETCFPISTLQNSLIILERIFFYDKYVLKSLTISSLDALISSEIHIALIGKWMSDYMTLSILGSAVRDRGGKTLLIKHPRPWKNSRLIEGFRFDAIADLISPEYLIFKAASAAPVHLVFGVTSCVFLLAEYLLMSPPVFPVELNFCANRPAEAELANEYDSFLDVLNFYANQFASAGLAITLISNAIRDCDSIDL